MRRWQCSVVTGMLLAASARAPAAPLLEARPAPGLPPNASVSPGLAPTVRGADGAAVALLRSALAADPLTSEAMQRQLLETARQELHAMQWLPPRTHSERQAAEAAFAFLHQRLLTGIYDPSCARLQRTLSDGTYNCLTATLLYLALCRDAGLRAAAVAAPGHVAVCLQFSDGACDVETTDRRWRPQSAATRPAGVREISDQALLGRVYYNLGIGFARAGNLPLAVQVTRVSYGLDPGHVEARINLLAMLNNWSIELARQGDYRQAEALIQEGLELDADHGPLRRTDAHVRSRWPAEPSR